MKKQIFLVSTGRTGTKFFSKFFADYFDNVSSYHTTKNSEFLNIVSNLYQLKIIKRNKARKAWQLLKNNFVSSHDGTYIECNPYYYGILDIISEFYKDLSIIHIIRSPKSYVISHVKKEKQNIKSRIANKLIPYWQPVLLREQIKGISGDFYQRVDFYSQVWNFKNKVISRSGTELPLLTFKFEDIFESDKGEDVLCRLLKEFNLEPTTDINKELLKRKINSTRSSKKIQWDNKCDEIVNKNCGNIMKRFGYL